MCMPLDLLSKKSSEKAMPGEWWQQEEDVEDFGVMLTASRQAGVSRQAG